MTTETLLGSQIRNPLNFTGDVVVSGVIYSKKSSQPELILSDNAAINNKQLLIYYDVSNDKSEIQSIHQNVAYTDLSLLPNGGDVYSVPWTPYHDTSTITGWASFTNKKIYYKELGKTVWVWFQLIGTSNSTVASFTLAHACDSNIPFLVLIWASDNGAASVGYGYISAGGSTLTCYKDVSASDWTATGSKQIYGQICYQKS